MPLKLCRWSSVGDPYLNTATAGPHYGGVRGEPHCVILHPSFESVRSDAPLRPFIRGWIFMGNRNTWGDYRLISAALE
jgi:hypothetical protein